MAEPSLKGLLRDTGSAMIGMGRLIAKIENELQPGEQLDMAITGVQKRLTMSATNRLQLLAATSHRLMLATKLPGPIGLNVTASYTEYVRIHSASARDGMRHFGGSTLWVEADGGSIRITSNARRDVVADMAALIDDRAHAAQRQNMVDVLAEGQRRGQAGNVDSLTAQLEKLNELHREGALSDEEYQAAKAKLIGGS